jgi:predicted transcriptional regulator of viral defense system
MTPDESPLDLEPRTLSPQEAAVVSWLETERRKAVTTEEVVEILGWPRQRVWRVMHRLAAKGWLRRTAKGRYETVLAETGGFAPANPWAALSSWKPPYYVGFHSAAYERGLTPDRPGDVQVCTPFGTRRPRAWNEIPIAMIWLRKYSAAGTKREEFQGWPVIAASPEKIVIDGAALPGRIGGLPSLARILARALEELDWKQVRNYSRDISHGEAGLRRLAALLELLEIPIPQTLAAGINGTEGRAPLYLGERRVFGAHGRLIRRWGVIDNVGAEALREEVER